MTQPFPLIEKALKELVETKYPTASGKVGGDLSYKSGDGLYVWISTVDSFSTQTDGQWVVDIDTFADSYAEAMGASLDLEAILIGPRHVTSLMVIDRCSQNQGPTERPWNDELVFRVGATYVLTARRTG